MKLSCCLQISTSHIFIVISLQKQAFSEFTKAGFLRIHKAAGKQHLVNKRIKELFHVANERFSSRVQTK